MKKLLLTIICVVAAMFAHAEGHMTFMGIEIDGTLDSFKSKLEKRGFTGVIINGAGGMTGKFTGEDVLVAFYATPKTNIVFNASVAYDPLSQWSMLETKYNSLVKVLTEKYGAPTEVIWDVSEYGDPEHELRMGRAKIGTRFECENGEVFVSIVNVPQYGITIVLSYTDKENGALYNSEIKSDL